MVALHAGREESIGGRRWRMDCPPPAPISHELIRRFPWFACERRCRRASYGNLCDGTRLILGKFTSLTTDFGQNLSTPDFGNRLFETQREIVWEIDMAFT